MLVDGYTIVFGNDNVDGGGNVREAGGGDGDAI